MTPALLFNKLDLADETDIERLRSDLSAYRGLGLEVHLTSALRGDGIEGFRESAAGGPIRTLRPLRGGQDGAARRARRAGAAERSPWTGGGGAATTTTGAELIPLSGGGEIVDTPGVRALGLDGLSEAQVRAAHPDLARHADGCRFSGCSHRKEPGCAVRAAVGASEVSESRYRAMLRLSAEAADLMDGSAGPASGGVRRTEGPVARIGMSRAT